MSAQTSDFYARRSPGVLAVGSYSPTLSDTVDLPANRSGIIVVLADGDVKFTGLDGVVDTWTGRVSGDVIPVVVSRVWATGTTATVKVLVI